MPDRFAQRRQGPRAKPVATAARPAARAAALAILVGTGALLAACSSSSDTSFSLFADPGKYQFHNCTQIAAEIKALTARRKDLKALMDRAEQSAGGAAVGLVAYRGEYTTAGEELELVQSAARSKKCEQDEAWRSSTVIR